MEIIKLKNVEFQYPSDSSTAISDVSLTIKKNDFIVIAGPSGCGKSTLLKLIKPELAPHGKRTGEYYYCDKKGLHHKKSSFEIGYVFQNPDNQIVSNQVRSELVFGMENNGVPTHEMRIRLAEIVELFGLTDILDKEIEDLSGGQKQLINLASIMLMKPKVILLDEPTAQLDPIAAKELLGFLKQLNEHFGTTIILVEHRLQDVLSIADQLILMENGTIRYHGEPKSVIKQIWTKQDHSFFTYIPRLAKLYVEQAEDVVDEHAIPLTIKEARKTIDKGQCVYRFEEKRIINSGPPILQCKNITFQYERNERRILNELNLSIQRESILAIFGSNGAGKSTLLKLLAGVYKPLTGKILYNDNMSTCHGRK